MNINTCYLTFQVLTRRPLVSSTRVCTPTGVPDCRGPCDGCGDYCEQVSQSWCDTSHSISTLVSEKTECDFNSDEGPTRQIHTYM